MQDACPVCSMQLDVAGAVYSYSIQVQYAAARADVADKVLAGGGL